MKNFGNSELKKNWNFFKNVIYYIHKVKKFQIKKEKLKFENFLNLYYTIYRKLKMTFKKNLIHGDVDNGKSKIDREVTGSIRLY